MPEYSHLHGLDYSTQLIENAKHQTFLNDIKLDVGSAESFNLNKKFDFIVCSGVSGYFDSLDKLFTQINNHLKSGGVALVFHLFNEFDIDILVKYRNNQYFDEFQAGWNVHSIQTAKKELEKLDLKLEQIHKFKLSFDDTKKEDPARSWTSYVDGEKKFINGLGQVYDLICLEIRK